MKTIARILTVLFVSIVLCAVCSRKEPEKQPDKVTVQLKWVHQAQFAGFYIAEKKGFYAEENIDVTFNPGGPDQAPETRVADLVSGKSTFAIIGGDILLTARSRGEPIVAIAVIFQRNPFAYAALKDSGIKRPHDFVGKKMMVPSSALVQHEALLRKLGIDLAAVELVPFEYDVTPLTTGQIDVYMLYHTVLGITLEEKGYEPIFIWVEDYGTHLYADTIVATEQLIQQNQELVKRFLRATLKGWHYAIENPGEALDVTLEYDATLDMEHEARVLTAQMPLIHTGKAPIGWMDRNVWEGMRDLLLEQGLITKAKIEQRAKEVAKQIEEYIKYHPNMTLKDLQADPEFQKIAVQQVGETGYTVVYDCDTMINLFHAKPELLGFNLCDRKEKLPDWWEITKKTIACKSDSEGIYKWEDPDGVIREKYKCSRIIHTRTADGVGMVLAATTYLDEYNALLKEEKTDIDKAFTTQFLNNINGKEK